MPTNRTRVARHRKEKPTLGPAERYYLLTGFWFSPGELGDDDAASLWLDHRDTLLSFWIQDADAYRLPKDRGFYDDVPGGVGTRPAAWWWFDVPEERRTVTAAEIIATEVAALGQAQHGEDYYRHHDLSETSYSYLLRLKLFTTAEKAYFARFPAIKAADWDLLQRNDWHTKEGRDRLLNNHQLRADDVDRARIVAWWERIGII
ncbi:MAG: hypothetical protein HY273_14725 [Gammaproteobacteria bacterium]|nr:hypothetical protein [Gammaproteobacteria bacterium]